MIISILCVDNKWGIGKKNGLLFSLPLDMNFFRKTTKGHIVALGENTLKSFPNGAPLKNRTHILIATNEYHYDNVIVTHDFDTFLKTIKSFSDKEDVYIIGGASIYSQTLPFVDKVLLTKVEADGGAELFFPNLDIDPNFECIDKGTPIQDGDYTIRFTTYLNNNKKPILF